MYFLVVQCANLPQAALEAPEPAVEALAAPPSPASSSVAGGLVEQGGAPTPIPVAAPEVVRDATLRMPRARARVVASDSGDSDPDALPLEDIADIEAEADGLHARHSDSNDSGAGDVLVPPPPDPGGLPELPKKIKYSRYTL